MTERENLMNAVINIMNVLTDSERQQIFRRYNITCNNTNNNTNVDAYPYTYGYILHEIDPNLQINSDYYYVIAKFKKTTHAIQKKITNDNNSYCQWFYDEFAKNEIIKEIKEKEKEKLIKKIDLNLSSLNEI